MLGNCADVAVKAKFVTYLSCVMESAELMCASEAMQQLPETLRDAAGHVLLMARGVYCLLCPRPHRACGPHHVQEILTYKGEVAALALTRDMIKKNPFNKMWDEVLAKDSATRDMLPAMERLEEALTPPVKEDDLVEACSSLRAWKTKVRAGSLQSLESRFHHSLHATAKALLECDGKGVTLRYFDKLLEGFTMYSDAASMNMHTQLTKLEGKVAKSLVVAEVERILEYYPHPAAGSIAEDAAGAAAKLEGLHAALCKCKDIVLSDALVKELAKPVYWHMYFLKRVLEAATAHPCMLQLQYFVWCTGDA
eukprot:s6478_g6.t1